MKTIIFVGTFSVLLLLFAGCKGDDNTYYDPGTGQRYNYTPLPDYKVDPLPPIEMPSYDSSYGKSSSTSGYGSSSTSSASAGYGKSSSSASGYGSSSTSNSSAGYGKSSSSTSDYGSPSASAFGYPSSSYSPLSSNSSARVLRLCQQVLSDLEEVRSFTVSSCASIKTYSAKVQNWIRSYSGAGYFHCGQIDSTGEDFDQKKVLVILSNLENSIKDVSNRSFCDQSPNCFDLIKAINTFQEDASSMIETVAARLQKQTPILEWERRKLCQQLKTWYDRSNIYHRTYGETPGSNLLCKNSKGEVYADASVIAQQVQEQAIQYGRFGRDELQCTEDFGTDEIGSNSEKKTSGQIKAEICKILGLETKATDGEIRSAAKKYLHKVHSDKFPNLSDDKKAELNQKFNEFTPVWKEYKEAFPASVD